ncbi:hypothetical protein AB432_017480 [Brevibacillus brevis]|uniref:Uncharacterized protein n=1 Tax=Brevibacillus brevis TaxID=1393 RepID=A0A2Z4MK10_BREBE|nr:hypothetical protein AB432_017480 [Brevibacillus brevis]
MTIIQKVYSGTSENLPIFTQEIELDKSFMGNEFGPTVIGAAITTKMSLQETKKPLFLSGYPVLFPKSNISI